MTRIHPREFRPKVETNCRFRNSNLARHVCRGRVTELCDAGKARLGPICHALLALNGSVRDQRAAPEYNLHPT